MRYICRLRSRRWKGLRQISANSLHSYAFTHSSLPSKGTSSPVKTPLVVLRSPHSFYFGRPRVYRWRMPPCLHWARRCGLPLLLSFPNRTQRRVGLPARSGLSLAAFGNTGIMLLCQRIRMFLHLLSSTCIMHTESLLNVMRNKG